MNARFARSAVRFVLPNAVWAAAFAALFHALPGRVPWIELFCWTFAGSAALDALQRVIEAAARRRRPSPK